MADARMKVAFVDVRAGFPVDLGVTFRAVAFVRGAALARRSPGEADGATAFRTEGQARHVIFALTSHHLRPA